jgi:hypothetical protein
LLMKVEMLNKGLHQAERIFVNERWQQLTVFPETRTAEEVKRERICRSGSEIVEGGVIAKLISDSSRWGRDMWWHFGSAISLKWNHLMIPVFSIQKDQIHLKVQSTIQGLALWPDVCSRVRDLLSEYEIDWDFTSELWIDNMMGMMDRMVWEAVRRPFENV